MTEELLAQFVIEGRELVERANEDLARLGGDPGDAEALDSLFRAMHTLKGSAAMFDLAGLTGLLHETETLLEAARADGALGEAAHAVTTGALDLTEGWIEALDEDASTEALAERTVAALARLRDEAPGPAADSGSEQPAWAGSLVGAMTADGPLTAVRYVPSADAYFRGDDPLAIARAIPGLLALELSAPPLTGDAYDPFRCTLVIKALSRASQQDVRAALRLVADQLELSTIEGGGYAASERSDLALRSLRIDAERLDALAALVDELVIARNALAHETSRVEAGTGGGRALVNAQAAMDRLVSDVHANVTSLRLVALRHVFGRFRRHVRELAESLGKDVELNIVGEQVEVDKSVAERLYEPLLHLLRNALDHGIEPAETRRGVGKRPRALLSVTARAAGDEVILEVADDGRGVDLDRVRRAAVERGAVSADAVGTLSDQDAAELIFKAGVSTASKVSDLSGRGVGMDAVRAVAADLGGAVALQNRPGQGLTVRLTLPAHVVLTRILVVKAGGERFGVPLESVTETHRVSPGQVTRIRAGRAYVRRDTVIPLLRLSELLGAPASADPGVFPVLSVSAAGEQVGIQIEEIGERIEAPLRPMSGLLAAYPGVVGTVLQGDGRVLLVLDLAELAA